jgi:transcriptional regulator with XRE-family HTH domain
VTRLFPAGRGSALRREGTAQALTLGAAIRRRRRELGLTLVQVAAATGLSHPFLSQLERGQTRGSMRSLFLVAEALKTSQQALLAQAGPAEPVVPVGTADGSARLLAQVRGEVALTEFSLVPDEPGEFFVHSHEELLYVVSGEVELELGAGDPQILEARESRRWPGGVPHRFRAAGSGNAVVLLLHPFDV